MLEQSIQNLTGGAHPDCRLKRVFHLAQNLGFAQHHRIKTGCHPEGMLDGFFVMRIDR